jgi:hypothetical protein
MICVDMAGARSTEEPADPSRTRVVAVTALVVAGVAVAAQIGKTITALPAMTSELGLSLTMSGWVLGVHRCSQRCSGWSSVPGSIGSDTGGRSWSGWW